VSKSVRRPRKSPPRRTLANSVFVNCPFDLAYQGLFQAIVFTVIDCGFVPRCALEIDDSSEARLDKIFRIIGECRLSLHDLSRIELDEAHGLPRFNMPFELGVFLGAKRFGDDSQRKKACLILDSEKYRPQKFLSDLAGQDMRAHRNEPKALIRGIRDWLTTMTKRELPGGADIHRRFLEFQSVLPTLASQVRLKAEEVTFPDLYKLAATWLDETAADGA